MASLDAVQVAERLGRLDERIEAQNKAAAATACNTAAQFDTVKKSIAELKNEDIAEIKADVSAVKEDMSEVKLLLSEAKGGGKVVAYIWPPVAAFIMFLATHFLGLK